MAPQRTTSLTGTQKYPPWGPHSLGHRTSAVSKSFTRQMGRNEALEAWTKSTEWRVTHEARAQTVPFQEVSGYIPTSEELVRGHARVRPHSPEIALHTSDCHAQLQRQTPVRKAPSGRRWALRTQGLQQFIFTHLGTATDSVSGGGRQLCLREAYNFESTWDGVQRKRQKFLPKEPHVTTEA